MPRPMGPAPESRRVTCRTRDLRHSTTGPLRIALLVVPEQAARRRAGGLRAPPGQGAHRLWATRSRSSRASRTPELDDGIRLVELPSLDTWNDHFPARMPGLWELKNWKDWVEVTSFSFGTFPEPLTFSLRAWDHLRHRAGRLRRRPRQPVPGLRAARHPAGVAAARHDPPPDHRRPRGSSSPTPVGVYGASPCGAGTASPACRPGWPAGCPASSPCRSRRGTTSSSRIRRAPAPGRTSCPSASTPTLFRPIAGRRPDAGPADHHGIADVAMKGLRHLLEAVAKVRTERDVVAGRGRQGEGERPVGRDPEPARADATRSSSCPGVSDERIVELYAEAELAVVPSLYEGFSLPAIEAMACGVPARRHDRRRPARGRRARRRRPRYLVPPGDAEALAAAITVALDDPAGRARVGAAGRRRVVERWSWRATAEQTVEQYRTLLDSAGRAVGAGRGGRADRSLRPARAAPRRPRARPRLRRRPARLRGRPPGRPRGRLRLRPGRAQGRGRAVRGHGRRRASSRRRAAPAPRSTATPGGCRSPTAASTGSSPPRCSSTSPTTRPPSPSWPGCSGRAGRWPSPCPAWLPERICWALSDEYHAPFVAGGHVRIYTEPRLRAKLRAAGLRPGRRPPRPRAALAVLVAQVRGRRRPTTTTPPWQAYHRFLVWDIMRAPWLDPHRRPAGEPGDRQEPRRLRPQARRPSRAA